MDATLLLLLRSCLDIGTPSADSDYAVSEVLSYGRKYSVLGVAMNHLSRHNMRPRILSDYINKSIASAQKAMLQETSHIINALSVNNIPALCFKGATLAKLIYDNGIYRDPCSDIDIMVNDNKLILAETYLNTIGYKSFDITSKTKEWRIKYRHDPIQLFNGRYHIDLHSTRHYNSVDVEYLFALAIRRNAFDIYDSFIFAVWHFYHNFYRLDYNYTVVNFKLRYITDIIYTARKCINTNKGELLIRIRGANASNVSCFALNKLVELYDYINEEAPKDIITLYKQIQNTKNDIANNRALEKQWRYGNYNSNFWSCIFDNPTEKAQIQKQINSTRIDRTYKIDKRKAMQLCIMDKGYTLEEDRIKSYLASNITPKEGLPYIAWGIYEENNALRFVLDVCANEIMISEETTIPEPASHLIMVFRVNSDQNNVYRAVVMAREEGAEVKLAKINKNDDKIYIHTRHTEEPEVYKTMNWQTARNGTNHLKISGKITAMDIPFKCSSGEKIGFTIRYNDYEKKGVFGTSLQWPSGVIDQGYIEIK